MLTCGRSGPLRWAPGLPGAGSCRQEPTPPPEEDGRELAITAASLPGDQLARHGRRRGILRAPVPAGIRRQGCGGRAGAGWRGGTADGGRRGAGLEVEQQDAARVKGGTHRRLQGKGLGKGRRNRRPG